MHFVETLSVIFRRAVCGELSTAQAAQPLTAPLLPQILPIATLTLSITAAVQPVWRWWLSTVTSVCFAALVKRVQEIIFTRSWIPLSASPH
jgi:hypothetical protein